MALSFAHGAIQWLAADAVSTVYTVSGLSFQPQALRFYWIGLQSATDTASDAVNECRGVGFAVSTSSRRCVGSFSQDTAATSNCGTIARNDAVACTTDGAGGNDGELDLNSITSDGFTLIVDDTAPQNLTVFWEAWGGDDITVATVGDFAEPAAAGDVDYTVTGFVAGAIDQVVMFAGVQSIAAINTGEAEASGMYVGFSAGSTSADNVVIAGNADDASTAMDTDGYFQTGECLAMCAKAGAAVANARATLTQFGTDNFRLNWIERGVTDRKSIFLAIKGGSWESGNITIDTTTINNTATLSSLLFAPVGMSLLWRRQAAPAADTFVATDHIGFGTGSSTTSRRSMAVRDEDATASSVCEIDTVLEYDQVLCFCNSDGTSGAKLDVNAMNSDGWQLIVDDNNGGSVNNWIGYLTYGDAPVAAVMPPHPTLAQDAMHRSFSW